MSARVGNTWCMIPSNRVCVCEMQTAYVLSLTLSCFSVSPGFKNYFNLLGIKVTIILSFIFFFRF